MVASFDKVYKTQKKVNLMPKLKPREWRKKKKQIGGQKGQNFDIKPPGEGLSMGWVTRHAHTLT